MECFLFGVRDGEWFVFIIGISLVCPWRLLSFSQLWLINWCPMCKYEIRILFDASNQCETEHLPLLFKRTHKLANWHNYIKTVYIRVEYVSGPSPFIYWFLYCCFGFNMEFGEFWWCLSLVSVRNRNTMQPKDLDICFVYVSLFGWF